MSHLFATVAEFNHIVAGQLQGFTGILHAEQNIFGVARSPAALCSIQREVQRVLADYTDRSHSHFHTRTSVMTVEDHKMQEFINEFFPISEDLSDCQRKNNLRLQEELKTRYYNAPDLEWVGKNGWRFINAVSDFATHADPLRKTKNYNENLFLRTAEGNPMIDKAYKMVLAAA